MNNRVTNMKTQILTNTVVPQIIIVYISIGNN